MIVNYNETCVLKVKKADNVMTVYLNADTGGANGIVFSYFTDALGEAPPNASVDLVPALGKTEGSGKLSIVGANFAGGGKMQVDIVADDNAHTVVNEELKTYSAKMWTVDIKKN